MSHLMRRLAVSALVIVFGAHRSIAVVIPTVVVGNPGNAADTRYNGISVGSVAYIYQIGKYEVTARQYTEFLNALPKPTRTVCIAQ